MLILFVKFFSSLTISLILYSLYLYGVSFGKEITKCHPLQPLSASEVQLAVKLLKLMPEFSPSIRIVSIMLKEPSKEIIYAIGDKWEVRVYNSL